MIYFYVLINYCVFFNCSTRTLKNSGIPFHKEVNYNRYTEWLWNFDLAYTLYNDHSKQTTTKSKILVFLNNFTNKLFVHKLKRLYNRYIIHYILSLAIHYIWPREDLFAEKAVKSDSVKRCTVVCHDCNSNPPATEWAEQRIMYVLRKGER